ncbi:MAG: hypothetical protein AABM67_15350 [Acidobacteriota bacterium]
MIDSKEIKRGNISALNAASKSLLVLSQSNAFFIALLILLFLCLGLAGILNHEMWRDELKAWLIARDSSSISNLFHNFRSEAHPSLWYLCLYALSRFTHNSLAMQLFHLMVATGVIFLFAGFSPFTNLQKALFSFGYFPFYEYAVISRNYAIGVLLIFSFCALFNKPKKNHIILLCVLTLLANTNLYSLIIAISLGPILLFDIIDTRKGETRARRKWTILGLLIFVLGIVVVIFRIIPPTYTPQKLMGTPLLDRYRFVASVMTLWKSYIPLPNILVHSFWSTNILMAVPHGWTLGFLFSLGLMALSSILFIRKPVVLFLYWLGTLGILTFTFTKLIGGVRHYGHLFILLIVCLWISGHYTELNLKWLSPKLAYAIDLAARNKNRFVTVILGVHLVAGIYAMSMDLFYPFSGSKQAATFIQTQRMANMPIVASSETGVAHTLSAYLDRRIYTSRNTTPEENLAKLNQLTALCNEDVLYVSNYRENIDKQDVHVSELAEFTNNLVSEQKEKFYLYLIRRPKTDTASKAEPCDIGTLYPWAGYQ